ncbi:3554_t:CDS:2 [Ambispora gerdemannii]|uniref:3554_t:CDS:1 n=1 Tax=Ambispora gerdemannii TaxID=144530 RepID=A0A9N9FQJ9_9GLOM|nr:3554_t:CDS:2 [Ambispora gerdemannii]
MPSKAPKYVYHGHSKIISGVIAVLENTSEPLSLQELVDEMTRRQLVVFHGATPRNTVSGEISKLLNAVGPNNAPILKVNQGKLTKFFLRPRLQQQHQHDMIKRRQMEDLKAAYLLSCLSAHSFWLTYKNEPEKDFKCFLEVHLGIDNALEHSLNAASRSITVVAGNSSTHNGKEEPTIGNGND